MSKDETEEQARLSLANVIESVAGNTSTGMNSVTSPSISTQDTISLSSYSHTGHHDLIDLHSGDLLPERLRNNRSLVHTARLHRLDGQPFFYSGDKLSERDYQARQLGYGGIRSYRSYAQIGSGKQGPFPIPRRGTLMDNDFRCIEEIMSHDIKPSGLRFRIKSNMPTPIEVEHFVMLRKPEAKLMLREYLDHLAESKPDEICRLQKQATKFVTYIYSPDE